MKANNLLERAEKFRGLGRFDKKSGIAFMNDALYEIAQRQSLKVEEVFYGFVGLPITLQGKIIKVEGLQLKGVENRDFDAKVEQDNSIVLFRKDSTGVFKKITLDDNIQIESITIRYVGFKIVKKPEDTVVFPSEFESSLVYFIRSKMLEETGDMETSEYFYKQFQKELIMKTAPKVYVIAEPSKYSLL